MDIDTVEDTASAPVEETPTDKAQEAALTALSECLAQLEETPDNVPILRRSVGHMKTLGLDAEYLDTMQRLLKLIMLDECSWAEYFDKLIEQSQPLTLESLVDILEAMDKAEEDYACSAALVRRAKFIIDASKSSDEEVSGFLSEETIREMFGALTRKAAGLLDESKDVWNVWIEWEQARGDQEQVHAVYNGLLATPHTALQSTIDAYSAYCSANCPTEYEARLVTATSSTQAAKSILDERRFHKTRSEYEEALAVTDIPAQGAIWSAYMDWELDPKSKKANPALISAVFERAVGTMCYAASKAYAEYKSLLPKGSNKKKGKRKEEEYAAADQQREVARALKEAEAGFWARYATWSVGLDFAKGGLHMQPAAAERQADQQGAIETYQRAVRACPDSGMLWGELLFEMERNGEPLEALRDTFEQALNLGVMLQPRSATTPIVDLFMSGAAFEGRHASESDQGSEHPVLATVKRGLEAVHHLSTSGDPSCRLERFLLDYCEARNADLLDDAIEVISKPNKSRSASYQMINALARRQDLASARETYLSAIGRTDLDWPEAVYEAYLTLETVSGTLDTVGQAKANIRREQTKLAKRREKAAAEQYQYQYYQQAAQAQAQAVQGQSGQEEQVQVVEVPLLPVSEEQAAAAPQAADGSAVAAATAIAEVPQAAASSSTQPEKQEDFKRDRENTTVMVSGLSSEVTIPQIETFLSECGTIREVVLVDATEGSKSALVEFRAARSVPKALEKDRKRMEGREVHVSMLWRSTLYVTNFDKSLDDTRIRALFEPFGFILQTRWPSKKYATTRRFCYVTMQSPSAAQLATSLHGSKEKGVSDFGLTVLISDPAAKKQRTDAGRTTLFVGGVASGTSEADVRDHFGKHGTIHYVTMKPGKVAGGKGIAFVDMSTEAEATAALALNGAHLNGSFIRVSIKDPDHASKQDEDAKIAAERRSRTVRLHNLPEGTQEGLLQQALEKIVPVKRLEVFARANEANAELNSQAEIGLLLLRTEPFIFNGSTITFSENTRKHRNPPPGPQSGAGGSSSFAAADPSSGDTTIKPTAALAFAPRNARKPGKTLGKGRAPPKDAQPVKSASGQNDFRAFMDSKNKQREEKLAAKRTAPTDGVGEDGDGGKGEGEGSAKRAKVE